MTMRHWGKIFLLLTVTAFISLGRLQWTLYSKYTEPPKDLKIPVGETGVKTHVWLRQRIKERADVFAVRNRPISIPRSVPHHKETPKTHPKLAQIPQPPYANKNPDLGIKKTLNQFEKGGLKSDSVNGTKFESKRKIIHDDEERNLRSKVENNVPGKMHTKITEEKNKKNKHVEDSKDLQPMGEKQVKMQDKIYEKKPKYPNKKHHKKKTSPIHHHSANTTVDAPKSESKSSVNNKSTIVKPEHQKARSNVQKISVAKRPAQNDSISDDKAKSSRQKASIVVSPDSKSSVKVDSKPNSYNTIDEHRNRSAKQKNQISTDKVTTRNSSLKQKHQQNKNETISKQEDKIHKQKKSNVIAKSPKRAPKTRSSA